MGYKFILSQYAFCWPMSFLPMSFWPMSFWPMSFWPMSFWPMSFWPMSFWQMSFRQMSFRQMSFWQMSFWQMSFWQMSFWIMSIFSPLWKIYLPNVTMLISFIQMSLTTKVFSTKMSLQWMSFCRMLWHLRGATYSRQTIKLTFSAGTGSTKIIAPPWEVS